MERKIHTQRSWFGKRNVLLAILALSALIIGSSMFWFVKQNTWLENNYLGQQEQVRQEELFQDLFHSVQATESNVRGYAISGNKKFVKDFDKISDSVLEKFNKLKNSDEELSLNNHELVSTLNRLIQEKIDFTREIKLLCDNNQQNLAISMINSEKGISLADSMILINEQKNTEFRSANKKAETVFLAVNKRNNGIAYFGIAFSIILIVLVVYLLIKEIQNTNRLSLEFFIQREFYRATIKSLNEGLIATNKNGEVVFMNPVAESLTGWNLEDAKNKSLQTVYNVINEETGFPFENVVTRILNAGKAVELENNTLLKSKRNDYLVISNSGSPVFDETGNVTGAVLVFNDITEQKKNEAELRESERQSRYLIENLPEAVYTCDELGYIQLYNKAAVKLWGREPLAGKDLWCGSWKLFNADGTELPHDKCPMAMTLKAGRAVPGTEFLVQRPDGSFRNILPSPTPLFNKEGRLIGAVTMLLDVTDKKEREILIRKTEEKYRNLFEQGNDAIVTYSFDGTIHEFNDIICTMSGYTKEEFAKMKLDDIIVGDLIISQEKYNAILAGELVTILRQCKRKDGGIVDMEFKTKMNAEGIVVAFGRDITERKRNEERIKIAINRYEILAKATSDTIWDWNIKEDNITYNRGMTEMFGYELDSVKSIVDWWKERLHPDDIDTVNNQLEVLFQTQGQNLKMEYRYRCADNSYKYIKDRAFVVYDEENNPVRMVGAMQDITYEKNHERIIAMTVIETQENERRELGMELHDNVNQLLSATLLYLGMATRSSKAGKEVSETLTECSNYINDAITDIRNLSHRLTPFTTEKVSLKEIINWLIEPMKKTRKFEINLQVDTMVDTVITNEIKTGFYRIIQEQLNNIVKHAGADKVDISITVIQKKLVLIIIDNGIGFDPRLVKAGIGLQNIKRRAEIFFGEAIIESSPGNGCKLIIEQPYL